MKKVFISHASTDAEYAKAIADTCLFAGLDKNQIFCSSIPEYGILPGNDFLESIRKELTSDVLVIFVLSRNFYASPICLCEMGATWALAKEHLPIVIPPFDFGLFSNVIPLTQWIALTDKIRLQQFIDKLVSFFDIKKPKETKPKRTSFVNIFRSLQEKGLKYLEKPTGVLLLAEFVLKNGFPKRDKDSYEFKLTVENVPENIYSVIYLLDESFEENRVVKGKRERGFKSSSRWTYGNFETFAIIESATGFLATKATIVEAFRRRYHDTDNVNIKAAIEEIARN